MAAREAIRVATIAKNRSEELRISLSQYQGHNLIDIRVYCEPYANRGEEKVATKKGIALSLEKLPALIDALRAAERRAREEGLLGENPPVRDEQAA